MSQFPKLPLWTDAWVADTHHLTRQARGTYLDLLVLMWRTPGCRVPNDDAWLGARLCLTPDEVTRELRPIISEYCKSDGNSITQKRLLQEWDYVRTRRDSLSVRAKSRWDKEKSDSYSNALRRNAPIPIPIPIPKEVSKEIGKTYVFPPPASRWAEERTVSAEWLEDAELARDQHQLPRIDLQLEAEQFQNYWASKSGGDATKRNWKRTWLNWALRSKGTNGQRKQSAHDKFLAAAASIIREELEPTGEGGDSFSALPFGHKLLPA